MNGANKRGIHCVLALVYSTEAPLCTHLCFSCVCGGPFCAELLTLEARNRTPRETLDESKKQHAVSTTHFADTHRSLEGSVISKHIFFVFVLFFGDLQCIGHSFAYQITRGSREVV